MLFRSGLGAAISAGVAMYEGKSTSEVLAAAAGGFVAGGLAFATMGASTGVVLTTGVVASATGNIVEQGINIEAGNQDDIKMLDIAVSARTGGLLRMGVKV